MIVFRVMHNFTMRGFLFKSVFLFFEIKMAKMLIFAIVWHFWGVKALLKSKYSVIKPLLNVTFNFELIASIFSLIRIILFELQQKN